MAPRNTARRPAAGPAARLRLEGLEGRETPATLLVTPVASPTAVNNDYTVIQAAVNNAQSGDTVQLVGTFNFAERNAARSWARGADGRAGTFDDYSVFVPEGRTGVTLTAASLGDAVVQGPGDRPQVDLESFLYFDGSNYHNWTVSNLDIRDFDLSIGMFAEAAGAFDGVTVTNNHIRVATDVNGAAFPRDSLQNVGINYAAGRNQTISDNKIDIPGDGKSGVGATDFDLTPSRFAASVGIQSQSVGGAGLDGLEISGNTIRVLNAQASRPEVVIGIWENGNAHRSNITVRDNEFLNDSPANDPARNLQYGFWVTSHSSSGAAPTTVTYSGNTVDGAGFGFRYLPDLDHAADPANAAVRFVGNTLAGVWGGFVVQSNGKAYLSGNKLTGVGAGAGPGVLVRPGSSVVLENTADRVTGFAAGVLVEGGVDAQGATVRGAVTVRNVALTGNGVGLLADGGTALVEGTDLQNNSTAGLVARNGALVDAGQAAGAADFTGLGTSAGLNNFTAGYAAGAALAIVDENTGPGYDAAGPDVPPGHSVMARGNLFAQPGATYIESVVRHDFDDPALGFVDYAPLAAGNDLAVTAAFVTTPAFVGQHLTLLLTVTNFGPADAADVTLTAAVPAGTTFLSAAADRGTVAEAGGVVTAAVGPLARGQTTTVRVVVRPTAAGPLGSTVSATAAGVDPDPANNVTTGTGTVLDTPAGVVRVTKVLGRLVITGDGADNAVQVVPGPAADSFTVIGLGGTQVRFGRTTGGSADVSGVTAGIGSNLGAGNDTLIVDGSGTTAPLALRGGLAVNLGGGDDAFYALHLAATRGLALTGGAGTDAMTVSATTLGRGLGATGGAGNDRLDVSGLVVGGGLVWAGGAGDNALTVAGSRVAGATTLTGSGGADTAAVTGSAFGSFAWAGGAGADRLSVADSVFGRGFAARGGYGADAVTVSRTAFSAGAVFAGGPDADRLDAGTRSGPVGSSRGNSFAKNPVVTGFEDVQS